ncbi:MAG: hypothetical protein K1X67_25110 [Fimbriimonadaceae bacterium]|nr:hypothetical protein [Fimbriimonadaceae bacterium]
MAIGRENYFWHKLHSLTGIIPIGFYMIQHLVLNSFSFAGPEKFNGVIGFFKSVPEHLLLILEIGVLGIPILFHSIYGLFITSRGLPNVSDKAYRWRENWMYTFQRYSGVALFFLLIGHVLTTTVAAKVNGVQAIEWQAWHDKLTANGYALLIIYALGVLVASYHLCYGLWNFCIRWGITISGRSQRTMQQVSAGAFVLVTLLGWLVLIGFLRRPTTTSEGPTQVQAERMSLAYESRTGL